MRARAVYALALSSTIDSTHYHSPSFTLNHSPSSADYGASLDSETTVGTALGLASCSGAQKRKQPHQPTASAATLSVAVAQKSAPMLA